MSAAPVDGFAMSDPLLNAVEAAKLLGVTPRTIRNYAADGRLPGVALGGVTRWRRSTIERVKNGEIVGAGTIEKLERKQ